MAIDRSKLAALVQQAAIAQRNADADLTDLDIAKVYRRVFAGPDGELVLLHLTQVLLGMGGAVWNRDPEIRANNAVRRDIADRVMALMFGVIHEDKPEVRK